MKKYIIIHNFTATASIEVIANNQEEAFQKARENDLDLADYNFELDTAEIGCSFTQIVLDFAEQPFRGEKNEFDNQCCQCSGSETG